MSQNSPVSDKVLGKRGQPGSQELAADQHVRLAPHGVFLSLYFTQRVANLWNSSLKDVERTKAMTGFKEELDTFMEDGSINGYYTGNGQERRDHLMGHLALASAGG